MLLLLLLGVGTQAPITNGVRAYASLTFEFVTVATMTVD